MSFVSYAQNFEDVMLWRALKDVDAGFYVDIGAQDPVIDSVSMAFYEHGWRGVHIEPTDQYSRKLRSARPDETVWQVAIGQGAAYLTFFEFQDTGLSTADPRIAQEHFDAGRKGMRTTVPLLSLAGLFEKIGPREIHWLKLDVEGLEKSVLESWGDSVARPWILVIESTKPMTQEQTSDDWEFLVLERGYRFVYFDGLNRYYVSEAHRELASRFAVPPNVFDEIVLSGFASNSYCRLADRRVAEIEAKQRIAENDARAALEQLNAVLGSASWRVTAPLRTLNAAAKKMIRSSFLRLHGVISHFPILARLCGRLLRYFPLIDRRLRRVLGAANPVEPVNIEAELSDKELQVLVDLRQAIARQQEKSR